MGDVNMNNAQDREFVNSLAKGLNLLMCFSKNQPVWSLSEIAKANDMNLPTAKRYLHTFSKLGFMVRDETTKTFQLTPKVLRLGVWFMDSMDIKQRLLPYMKVIRNEMDVTTHCAVIEGREIVTVERIRSSDVVNLDLTAGSRLPIHASSLGKAILAFKSPEEQKAIVERLHFKRLTPHTITDKQAFFDELATTRLRGYAVATQELSMGLKTRAVPIFDRNDKVKGAFGVSYPISRCEESEFEEALAVRLIEVGRKA